MVPTVLRLTPADAARYVTLRRRMLTDSPWSFGASLDDDRFLDAEAVGVWLGDPHNLIFAVEQPAGGAAEEVAGAERELAGAVGITRMQRGKFAHRASVWGVFVTPEEQGRGWGRALMEAAIGAARGWAGVDYLDLTVSENAPAARRLYERLGFAAWGREPEALAHDGRRYDEIYMTLRL